MSQVEAVRMAAPALDVHHVVSALGLRPRQTGPNAVRVLCPWHRERNPSCAVSVVHGALRAKCFACGEGGDLFALVAVVNGLDCRSDFRRVLELAADIAGVRLDTPTPPQRREPNRLAVLARAVELAADDWAAGRAMRPGPELRDETEALEVLRLLATADVRAKERAEALERHRSELMDTMPPHPDQRAAK